MRNHQFVQPYQPITAPMVDVADLFCLECREEIWACECSSLPSFEQFKAKYEEQR